MKFENKESAASIMLSIEKMERLLKELSESDVHDVIIERPGQRGRILVVQTYLAAEEYKPYANSFIEAIKSKLRTDIKELHKQLSYL